LNAGFAAAAANPDNPRYAVVAIAGMDAYSTWKAAPRLPELAAAEVVLLPNGGAPKPLAGAFKGRTLKAE
jgi:hypothetical protein